MGVKKVYLISDSTGELGERFVNALATQFPEDRLVLEKYNFVQEKKDVERVFSKIASSKNVVLFHTALSKDLKRLIEGTSKARKIPTFDLTGPPTDFLIDNLGVKPLWDVQKLHLTNQEYEKRIEAIEFTIDHDDGAGEKTVRHADAILAGPSRASKTPTSMYLAMKGCKTANIPLIRSNGEPAFLSKLKDDPRVYGFIISPAKLLEMRRKRVGDLGSEPAAYIDLREISREVVWCKEIYLKYGWKTIDVTDRAIEETAAIVLKDLVRKQR